MSDVTWLRGKAPGSPSGAPDPDVMAIRRNLELAALNPVSASEMVSPGMARSGAKPGAAAVAPPGSPGRPMLSPAARAFPEEGTALLIVILLSALRLAATSFLPLSFDESYFWLWSKHLAISYYDHPPLIAIAIKLGTLALGDNELGVRAVSFIASLAASWAVWRAGSLFLGGERAGAFAACLFNATLMMASQSMSATPDALVLAAASFLILALAKLETTGNSRWWLAVGVALATAMLAKFTALFLIAGAGLYAIGSSRRRLWLTSPWLYAGFALAALAMVPNIVWNAGHDWVSYKFQFGRVGEGKPGIRFVFEFLFGQIAMASPFVLVPAILGLAREARSWPRVRAISIPASLMLPGLGYFAVHSLHDRVQGNWPSFVYPALVILATGALLEGGKAVRAGRWRAKLIVWSRMLALPVALMILGVCYLQALTGVLPLGKRDPIARMTAVGINPVAQDIAKQVRMSGAHAVVTTKYALTGWLSFYLKPSLPIIQLNEEQRWLDVPRAGASLLKGPVLYVTQSPRQELDVVKAHFTKVVPLDVLVRDNRGIAIDKFHLYALTGFHGAPVGRIANQGAP